jgi:uncharacterized membrane protein YeaQ/YmgE (transglycosylase-associated protein family)
MNVLIFLVIGLVAGWLAGLIVKGRGFGLVGNLVVGVLGSVAGGLIFQAVGVSEGAGLGGAILVAVIGALVLLFLISLIKRNGG